MLEDHERTAPDMCNECKELFPLEHLHEYGDERACQGCHQSAQNLITNVMLSPEETQKRKEAQKKADAAFDRFFKS